MTRPFELILASVAYGVIAALVFRRFTSPGSLRTTLNRILAHVLELRLFIDEPRLVLRAQRELLRENLHLLFQIALPCLMMSVLFVPLYEPMDHRFGRAPLRLGETAVVTAPLFTQLTPPPGIVFETPGVRVLRAREISWRVRVVRIPFGDFPNNVEVHTEPALWLPWFLLISTVSAALTRSLL